MLDSLINREEVVQELAKDLFSFEQRLQNLVADANFKKDYVSPTGNATGTIKVKATDYQIPLPQLFSVKVEARTKAKVFADYGKQKDSGEGQFVDTGRILSTRKSVEDQLEKITESIAIYNKAGDALDDLNTAREKGNIAKVASAWREVPTAYNDGITYFRAKVTANVPEMYKELQAQKALFEHFAKAGSENAKGAVVAINEKLFKYGAARMLGNFEGQLDAKVFANGTVSYEFTPAGKIIKP